MKRIQSTDDIAEIFDIDPATIRRYVRRGCPSSGKGESRRFNADEVAAWMKENKLTGKIGKPSEPVGEQLQAAKLRKELAMAEKHEIALAREKGLLVEAAKVLSDNVEKFTLIRNRFLGLPGMIASFLVGKTASQIEAELDSRVREILEALSKS